MPLKRHNYISKVKQECKLKNINILQKIHIYRKQCENVTLCNQWSLKCIISET